MLPINRIGMDVELVDPDLIMTNMNTTEKITSSAFSKDPAQEREFLRYAEDFLVRRGLIANTLGNMAVRVRDNAYPEHGVVYTKRRGICLGRNDVERLGSLEVITDRLLSGSIPPSNGHKMSRAIFAIRKDANAVIRTMPISSSAIFRKTRNFHSGSCPVTLLSSLVLSTTFARGVNIETDPAQMESTIADSNCFVMPNHGLTTVGRTLSEAYNRHTAFLSEVWRLILAIIAKSDEAATLKCVDESNTRRHYELSEQILNGGPLK